MFSGVTETDRNEMADWHSFVNPLWAIKIRNHYKFHQIETMFETAVFLGKLQNYIICPQDLKRSRSQAITNLNIYS